MAKRIFAKNPSQSRGCAEEDPSSPFRPRLLENWPFDNDQYILLNIAMGGNLGGTVAPDFTEDIMEVDYVRVYQK